jgi:hypothetical protein
MDGRTAKLLKNNPPRIVMAAKNQGGRKFESLRARQIIQIVAEGARGCSISSPGSR